MNECLEKETIINKSVPVPSIRYGVYFLVKDTSINKLTIQEMGGGGKFLGSLFFRTINNEKDFF